MPGRLTNSEVISAIEQILIAGVPTIKLGGLSREDAISWRDCFELEGKYQVDMYEHPKPSSFYSVEIRRRRN
ncbi:MAG: hypothetical protein AABX79_01925 [Nanoarchaeota archaeon]